MFLQKRTHYFSLLFALYLICFSGCTVLKSLDSTQKFSFAVLADPRHGGETWINTLSEIRDRNVNSDPKFDPVELVLVAGDIDPIDIRHNEYKKVFSQNDNSPVFLPVIGNHEFEDDGKHFRYVRDTMIPSIANAVRRHPTSCDYYYDYKNVRFIIVDGYTDLGDRGVINPDGRQWVEQTIKSTPVTTDHIFISFHEPAFPRYRHINDSFNADPEKRDAFWKMLLNYKDKVRAVLVGHTHYYYRLCINDPAGISANDMDAFPIEEGGIYQIDAGSSGNSDKSTIVQTQVNGKNVSFKVLQADYGSDKPFSKIDEWQITGD